MTDFISRLKELRGKATQGRWLAGANTANNGSIIDSEHGRVADFYQFLDVYSQDFKHDVYNAELIATMKNSLDLWLELAEAVEDNIIAGNHTTERLRLAFANLSGDLFGETETLSTPENPDNSKGESGE